MRRNGRIGLALIAALQLSGCVRLGFSTGGGNRDAADRGVLDGPFGLDIGGLRDSVSDSALFDLAADPCASKTTDGIHLNPGCDPQVVSQGLTSLSNDPIGLTDRWLLVSGTRWWIFDPAGAGGAGKFTDGGKDFAARLRQEKPDCSAMTTDGIALNPGCDPSVQSKGFTSVAAVTMWGKTFWVGLSGSRYWYYDPLVGAFVNGGKDLGGQLLQNDPKDCSKTSSDGTSLNPGCDADVKLKGFTAMTNSPPSSTISWAGFSGKKWWVFDPTTGSNGAFVDAGADTSQVLRLFPPSCAAQTPDGIALNPGCDPDVQQVGFTAAATVESDSTVYWLGVSGKKWWLFDRTVGAGGTFELGGKDISALLKASVPPLP